MATNLILTPTQQFQNSVNSVPMSLAQILNANNPQGVVGAYNKAFASLFSNANGTAAEAVANLGVGAAAVFVTLTALHTFLASAGVADIKEIPAYTANNDGTVTLTIS